ncbi:MAG: hypothetical protein SF339_28200 [Blastocatellia bacterium]|nr:hypothetical protein [Blastocatellia bacterium]
MKFTKPNLLKCALLSAAVVLTAVGAMIANTVTKQRDAMTNVMIEICQKDANGQWQIIDKGRAPSNFTASIADLATGKELSGNISWSTRTTNGANISVRMARAAKVNLNTTAGTMMLDVPFEVTVNGKRTSFTTKLSTESQSTPIGTLSGKRAEINMAARSLQAGVAGFSSINNREIIAELVSKQKSEKAADANGQKKEIRAPGVVGGAAGLPSELIVVIKGDGKVVAR